MKDLKPTDKHLSDGRVIRNGKTYGCYTDLDPGEKPTGCVLDDDDHRSCLLATLPSGMLRRSRWTCQGWKAAEGRPVWDEKDPAVLLKMLRALIINTVADNLAKLDSGAVLDGDHYRALIASMSIGQDTSHDDLYVYARKVMEEVSDEISTWLADSGVAPRTLANAILYHYFKKSNVYPRDEDL